MLEHRGWNAQADPQWLAARERAARGLPDVARTNVQHVSMRVVVKEVHEPVAKSDQRCHGKADEMMLVTPAWAKKR